VSNTVTDSFGKSFLAGLFAQPLLLPLFAMLIVGLAITLVGILLIPIAVIASFVAVVGAGTGGYLAVAKSVGATFLTRRQAQGHAVAVTPYRSLIFGLIGLMAIWGPAVILGWVPVVGDTLALLAAIFTWVMATAGFGAAILSRAGLRETFGRHSHRAALTDEDYWPAGTGEHRPVRRPIRRDR
jgi:MFS family permease